MGVVLWAKRGDSLASGPLSCVLLLVMKADTLRIGGARVFKGARLAAIVSSVTTPSMTAWS